MGGSGLEEIQPAEGVLMNRVYCRKDDSLTEEERGAFAGHLERQKLSGNVWDLFGEWVARSTPRVRFFYLKAYVDTGSSPHGKPDEKPAREAERQLVGLALFLKLKPFDLRSSYSGLRKNAFLNSLAGGVSALSRNCVYLSFRNLITSNLTRPFFFQEPGMEDAIMRAFLDFLKNEREADMVTIVDTRVQDRIYEAEGFRRYPSSSEAYLDATKYQDVSAYLGEHRSLRKNLRRRNNTVTTRIQQGPLSEVEMEQIKACVECSIDNSRVNNPCQKFFEENVFDTEVFTSDKYTHILVHVEGKIAGFHTFQICGSHMGGVLGGFNRRYSKNHFVYERVIVASLDHAIRNGFSRVHYSLVDNRTKLRLVDSLEPCGLYFFSRSPFNRQMFQLTYRYGDVYELSLLETRG
jgi:hypothetical protein